MSAEYFLQILYVWLSYHAQDIGINPIWVMCHIPMVFTQFFSGINHYNESCEKPTPLGVGWIAQKNIKGFDTSLILSLMDTEVSLVVKVL